MKLEELKVKTDHFVEDFDENFTTQIEKEIQEANDEHAPHER